MVSMPLEMPASGGHCYFKQVKPACLIPNWHEQPHAALLTMQLEVQSLNRAWGTGLGLHTAAATLLLNHCNQVT
jgi:hypothetical protein